MPSSPESLPVDPVAALTDSRGFSARSVIASILLGRPRGDMVSAQLVRLTQLFGFAEGTVRVALSRMVAAGELGLADGRYTLSGALLDRHLHQEEARHPELRPWDGTWRMAVVGVGPLRRRSVNERADLRQTLKRLRLAEWREGVWLRPDNLAIERDARPPLSGCSWFHGCRPSELDGAGPQVLAGRLWDLNGWSSTAQRFVQAIVDTPADDDLGATFRLSASVVRHIRDDPLLPEALLPLGWPGIALRERYADYQRQFETALARGTAGT